MQNRNRVLALVALAVGLLSSAGCAAPSPTPVPPTAAPPTATAVPPTATTLPPTATTAPTATLMPTKAPVATATTAAVATTAAPTGSMEMAKYYPKTPPSISAGAKVYAANCATCHGDKGDGKGPVGAALNPPPANFTDLKFARGDPPEDWYQSIANGRPGTAMPAWKDKLSESDLWNVLFFERRFATTPDRIAAGKALFAQNCAMCHGDQGNGKGPTGTALKPPPANFTDAQMMSAHTSQELFDTLTSGKGMMPSFKTTLTDDQRWSLVDYLWTFMTAP